VPEYRGLPGKMNTRGKKSTEASGTEREEWKEGKERMWGGRKTKQNKTNKIK
jgi:hypothetical protein